MKDDIAKLIAMSADKAANAIVITDQDGKILWVNSAFSLLTGYSYDEVIGQNPRVLKSDLQAPEFYHELWETIKAKKTWRGILTNKRKDGVVYRERMTITPVSNGGSCFYIAVKENYSEQARLFEALRRSEERFSTAYNIAEVAMFVMSPEGNFLKSNFAACRMFGYSEEEFRSKTWRDITHPDDKAASRLKIESMIKYGDSEFVLKKRYICKSGKIVYGQTRVHCVRDEAGGVEYMVAQVRDVTKQVEAEMELSKANMELEKANKIFRVVAEISSLTIEQPDFSVSETLSVAGEKLEMGSIFIQSRDAFGDMYSVWLNKDVYGDSISLDVENKQRLTNGAFANWLYDKKAFFGTVKELPEGLAHLQGLGWLGQETQVFVVPITMDHTPWGVVGFSNINGHRWSQAEKEALSSLSHFLAAKVKWQVEKNAIIEHIESKFAAVDTVCGKMARIGVEN